MVGSRWFCTQPNKALPASVSGLRLSPSCLCLCPYLCLCPCFGPPILPSAAQQQGPAQEALRRGSSATMVG
jgi:hypothetical protein